MAKIIPGDHFQLTVHWTSTVWDSGGGASVFGFRNDSTDETSVAAATALAALLDNLGPLTTDTVTCTGATWLAPPLGGSLLASTTGGLTSTVAAPNGTMLLRKVTDYAGRRGRGRCFWPYMASEVDIDEVGVVGSTRLAAINSAMQDVVADWTTASIAQVILQGDEGASSPIDPPPTVTGFFCDAKIATQRQRLRR